MTATVLSLGANLGDRLVVLRRAAIMLRSMAFTSEMQASSVYETEPVGFREQPPFFNIAIAGKTLLASQELLDVCKNIEQKLGRHERPRWREREIDIDILLYGDIVIARGELELPHPCMLERRFALVPAAEIAPDFIHPVANKTLSELAALCPDKSEVRPICNLF